MGPTVKYVLSQVKAGTYVAQDLKDFSMMGQGGASLAPLHGFEKSLDPALVKQLDDLEQQIQTGLFRVDINEGTPDNSVIATATPDASS